MRGASAARLLSCWHRLPALQIHARLSASAVTPDACCTQADIGPPVSRAAGPSIKAAPPLTAAAAAMLQPLLLLPLLLSATSQAAARIPPTGRNDVSVVTTDVVPAAGTFHFVAADSPTPRYVYASDAARHVVRRKDISKGEGGTKQAHIRLPIASFPVQCNAWSPTLLSACIHVRAPLPHPRRHLGDDCWRGWQGGFTRRAHRHFLAKSPHRNVHHTAG